MSADHRSYGRWGGCRAGSVRKICSTIHSCLFSLVRIGNQFSRNGTMVDSLKEIILDFQELHRGALTLATRCRSTPRRGPPWSGAVRRECTATRAPRLESSSSRSWRRPDRPDAPRIDVASSAGQSDRLHRCGGPCSCRIGRGSAAKRQEGGDRRSNQLLRAAVSCSGSPSASPSKRRACASAPSMAWSRRHCRALRSEPETKRRCSTVMNTARSTSK